MQFLAQHDSEIHNIIIKEHERQQNQISVIASENYISKAVMEAQGSALSNKYAEGYPGRRYYSGCDVVDMVESVAIDRAKKMFNADYANVQPHSGSSANIAAFLALLKPHDKYLSLALSNGGHLTHGSTVNFSGKWFDPIHYDLNPETHLIDFNQLEDIATKEKPKLIVAGASAYARELDFKIFREIADKVGAYLMVDMAHFAGLVVGGQHNNPVPYADICTMTTHKVLRGPRGGMIVSRDSDLTKKFNSAVFPGSQGGPLEHIIAAKAVSFKEALSDDYTQYTKQVVENAKVMASTLQQSGIDIVSGGTDTHIVLVDLRKLGVKGNTAEEALKSVNIICNKNTVPFDTESPMVTSGVRLGSAAITTRKFTTQDTVELTNYIAQVLNEVSDQGQLSDGTQKDVAQKVNQMAIRLPIPEVF